MNITLTSYKINEKAMDMDRETSETISQIESGDKAEAVGKLSIKWNNNNDLVTDINKYEKETETESIIYYGYR